MTGSSDDVLAMLDALLERNSDSWWDEFFADRAKPCPFFVDVPDENLVEWLEQGLLHPGRALELGCGNGRNAVHLAAAGFRVDAIDFSPAAIALARDKTAGAAVDLQCCSIFDAAIADAAYDVVYDSGCFHHLPPHRRRGYVELVDRALKPGGRYGLVCFQPEGGSGFTDEEVYERRSLGGGLGYSASRLQALWGAGSFTLDVLRPMAQPDDGRTFGHVGLWALLATKG